MRVYFAEPDWTWRVGCLRVMSGSLVVHCAVASGGWVLERTFEGYRVVWEEAYVRGYPVRLRVVSCGTEVEFPFFPEESPYPVWGVLRKVVFGGYTEWAGDCVGVTCRLLVMAGVAVPRRIATPAMLLQWLSERYEVVELG